MILSPGLFRDFRVSTCQERSPSPWSMGDLHAPLPPPPPPPSEMARTHYFCLVKVSRKLSPRIVRGFFFCISGAELLRGIERFRVKRISYVLNNNHFFSIYLFIEALWSSGRHLASGSGGRGFDSWLCQVHVESLGKALPMHLLTPHMCKRVPDCRQYSRVTRHL